MKTYFRRARIASAALVALAGVAGAAAPAHAAGCAGADNSLHFTTEAEARSAMVCLVNDTRTKVGAPKLTVHSTLASGAQKVADTLNPYTGKISFAGIDQRAKTYCSGAAGCTFYEFGHVAGDKTTPRTAVNAMLANADLKKILINPALRDVGAGANQAFTSGEFPTVSTAFVFDIGRRY